VEAGELWNFKLDELFVTPYNPICMWPAFQLEVQIISLFRSKSIYLQRGVEGHKAVIQLFTLSCISHHIYK